MLLARHTLLGVQMSGHLVFFCILDSVFLFYIPLYFACSSIKSLICQFLHFPSLPKLLSTFVSHSACTGQTL